MGPEPVNTFIPVAFKIKQCLLRLGDSFFDQLLFFVTGGGGDYLTKLTARTICQPTSHGQCMFLRRFPARSIQNMFLHNMICNTGQSKAKNHGFFFLSFQSPENKLENIFILFCLREEMKILLP